MSQNEEDIDQGQDEDGESSQGQDTLPEAKLAPEEGANVILAHGMSPITEPTKEHEGEVNIGMNISIKLPPAAQQRAGFKLGEVEASALIAQYGGRYKRFKAKAAEGQGREGGES